MFNIGPMELLVLAIVAIVVVGPEKLPGLAKEAATILRTLREIATGARQQLRDELGPEFADLDLRNLNPRTAVQRAVFGDDVDLGRLNPRNALRDAIFRDEDVLAADPRRVIRETRFDDDGTRYDETLYEAPAAVRQPRADTARVDMAKASAPSSAPRTSVATSAATSTGTSEVRRPRPRPRPSSSPYDADAT